MAAASVAVENLSKRYRVDARIVAGAAKKVLKEVRPGDGIDIEVRFVDDGPMRRLNKRFKGRDRSTDVLSFDLDGFGSIAISLDAARRNAKVFGTPVYKEAVRYVIHGILHMSGYDDDTAARRKRMAAKEERLLWTICADFDLSKALTRL